MKRIFIAGLFILFPIQADAIVDWGTACGEIDKIRTWVTGDDRFGVWFWFKSGNPSECPGGFYLPHISDNKQQAYSSLLSARMTGQQVCIQIKSLAENIDNRCITNSVQF